MWTNSIAIKGRKPDHELYRPLTTIPIAAEKMESMESSSSIGTNQLKSSERMLCVVLHRGTDIWGQSFVKSLVNHIQKGQSFVNEKYLPIVLHSDS